MTKNIAILGSTGSIGRQTLDVIDRLGPGYRVVALTAGKNYKLLAEQVRKYQPPLAVLGDESATGKLASELKGVECCVESGLNGHLIAATLPEVDLAVMAQVGFSGFEPLLAALKAGKKVALANKEALVIGGEIISKLGYLEGDQILPLDSEHSAIWQCWGKAKNAEVEKIFLTASGGPFYGWSADDLSGVKAEEALKHPNWNMGPKITIDSATMMNKGLEVIEARWLFKLRADQVEVVVHPQSIIHSMVEFVDGTIIAQLSEPDMRLPIQYALTYPDRKKSGLPRFEPFGKTLDFRPPDRNTFTCLGLAEEAAASGGTMPACLNGANEIAVAAFIDGQINFNAIATVVGKTMQAHKNLNNPDIKDIVSADGWSRQQALDIVEEMTGVG